MADIQHKDIPDSELHEAKGVVSALSNTVLTASGTGGSSFKKVDVAMLSGSIPNAIPNLILSTDGTGGLTYTSPSYARFTIAGGSLTSEFSQGFVIAGANFQPSVSGFYWFSTEQMTFTAPSTLTWPILRNVSTASNASPAMTGLVYLDSNFNYSLNGDGSVSIWKINV